MITTFVTHDDIAKFADEKVNLPSDLVKEYREQVNNLREKLEKRISEDPSFGLVKMLHSGSVAKGTALKTLNDMDVAVFINVPLETKENELLDWLLEKLKQCYPTLDPSQFTCPSGSHCVTISFRGSGLNVDIVPVIYEENAEDYGYLITKDSGERVLTNISLHLEFIRKRKQMQPHHFRQIVRLIKWWVRQEKIKDQNFKFKSFMVEMICAHLADNGQDMSDYPTALQKIFTYIVSSGLKKRISFNDYNEPSDLPAANMGVIEIFDPVNPGNNVAYKYTEQDRLNIVSAAHNALDALTEAQFATTKERAVEMWKIVFGPSFRA